MTIKIFKIADRQYASNSFKEIVSILIMNRCGIKSLIPDMNFR